MTTGSLGRSPVCRGASDGQQTVAWTCDRFHNKSKTQAADLLVSEDDYLEQPLQLDVDRAPFVGRRKKTFGQFSRPLES